MNQNGGGGSGLVSIPLLQLVAFSGFPPERNLVQCFTNHTLCVCMYVCLNLVACTRFSNHDHHCGLILAPLLHPGALLQGRLKPSRIGVAL